MGIVQAIESFGTTRKDGTPENVQAGNLADESSWVVKANPGAFREVVLDYPADKPVRDTVKHDEKGVEQATKKPGERRKKSSG